jgi:hypothetical protein
MLPTIRKYQMDRADLLINTDWGLPEDALPSEEALDRDLVLVPTREGEKRTQRWVLADEKKLLEKQAFVYNYIRAYGFCLMIIGIAAAVVVALLHSTWSAANYLAVYSALFCPLYFVTGVALFFYLPRAWILMELIVITHVSALLIDAFYFTDLPLRVYLLLGLAISTPMRVTFFFAVPSMVLLLSRTAKRILKGPGDGKNNRTEREKRPGLNPAIRTLIQALTLPGVVFTIVDAMSRKLDWSAYSAIFWLDKKLRDSGIIEIAARVEPRRALEWIRGLFR